MANGEIASMAMREFISKWLGHPISFSIITIFMNMAFVSFLSSNTKLQDSTIFHLALVSAISSLVIMAAIFTILYKKKNVLYNMLEVLRVELEHRMHIFEEHLSGIYIGVGDPYDEDLERLCPGSRQIKPETRTEVAILEFLAHIQKDCGIEPDIADETNLALAKFYYKEAQFEKALQKVNAACADHLEAEATIRASDLYYCKGLILRELGRHIESMQAFHHAAERGHRNAECWECAYMVHSSYVTLPGLEAFFDKAKRCPNSSSSETCINKMSTAYYKKARFYSEREEKILNLDKAISYAAEAIREFDSWPAYYNIACDYSLKGQYGGERRQLKDEIYKNLEKAFSLKPALIRHSMEETDLKWYKDTFAEQYCQLVGKSYTANFKQL